MKIKNISFPYPILGIGNDINSTVKMNTSLMSDKDNYIISFEIQLDNPDIENLINQKKALYVCEIDCPTTYFRIAYKSQTPTFEIKIPRSDVANRITFQCTITAIKQIENYQNSKFHEDYQGFSFNLDQGDLLAYLGEAHYDADIKYDKLKSAGAFMTIVEGHDIKYTTYYLEHEKIEIHLPPELYQRYKKSFNNVKKVANIFHSSIAFNALVYALLNYKDEHKEKLWAKTIDYRLQIEPRLQQYKNAIIERDPQNILKLAEELLGDPYKRLFKTVDDLLTPDFEEEY